jgi:hypothetical protein
MGNDAMYNQLKNDIDDWLWGNLVGVRAKLILSAKSATKIKKSTPIKLASSNQKSKLQSAAWTFIGPFLDDHAIPRRLVLLA